MRAVDTNIIVRLLTADEPDQFRRAKHLVASEDVFVSVTVLLETEWVLRSIYRVAVPQIIRQFRNFGGLPTVSLENRERLAQAFDLTDAGMDFADALHLSRCAGCEDFVTFDQHMIGAARSGSPLPVVSP